MVVRRSVYAIQYRFALRNQGYGKVSRALRKGKNQVNPAIAPT
jgi:hypothetical protein